MTQPINTEFASQSTINSISNSELIKNLGDRLELLRPNYDLLDSYLEGRQRGALGLVAPEVRESVGNRITPVIINYPRLVLNAIEERLDVIGFRLGNDEEANDDLWNVWQSNGMDLQSQQAHVEALLYGRCPVTVWADGVGVPRITVESARQVFVSYAPGTRKAVAAVKLWAEDGYGRAILFLPDAIRTFKSKGRIVEFGGVVPADGWEQTNSEENKLGVIPVVELTNRNRLLGGPESELVDVLPIADAIAKLATDMMVSAEFSAMPRRWVTGIEIPERLNADTGEMEPDTSAAFSQTAGRTWFLEDTDSKAGQFPEATLTGYVAGIETLTQQLASVSAIPAHYLNSLTGQLPSAESLRAAEASLVAKVKRKMTAFGQTWEDVARLAWLIRDGVVPDGAERLETVWSDPESRTRAMEADAALKMRDLGVPFETLMRQLGFTPAQVSAMRSQRITEAIDRQGADLTLIPNDDAAA